MALTAPTRPPPASLAVPARIRAVVPVVREALLLVLLLLLYSGARLLADQDLPAAFDHASRVLALEQWLHLPQEQHVQALLLHTTAVARAANAYYALAHLPVTALALLWLFLRRPAEYRWARRALVMATTVALAIYLVLPVAPPRMLSWAGFVDVAQMLGQSVYDSGTGGSLTNQYAAMPSLHVGWAVLVAAVCIAAGRSHWRWLWIAHPVCTVLVVVGTGNHYWLDALAGLGLVSLALLVTRPRTAVAAAADLSLPAVPAPRAPVS